MCNIIAKKYAKNCEKHIHTIFTVTLMTKCLRRSEEGGHQRRSLRILMYQCKELFKHLLNALYDMLISLS